VPLIDRKKSRFLHRGGLSKDVCYLLEKKQLDGNITEQDRVILEKRIQRLVSLLSAPIQLANFTPSRLWDVPTIQNLTACGSCFDFPFLLLFQVA
jgi:hypothetical protein